MRVAFEIAPFVNWLVGVLFLINLLLLLFALMPKARGVVGLVIFISSYIYGLSGWIYGLAVTLALWGWVAAIIGLFLGGVGVVPIGILASIFNGEWGAFWTLLLTILLTYGSRAIGYILVRSIENQIDSATVESKQGDKGRTWGDIE